MAAYKRGSVVALKDTDEYGVVLAHAHVEDEHGPDGVSNEKLLVVVRARDKVVVSWHPGRVRVVTS